MLFLNNAFTKDITEYDGEVLKEVKTVDGKIYLSNGAIIKEGVVGKFFDIATNDKYGTVFEADGPDEIGPIVGFAPVMRAIADGSQDSSAEWLKNYLNIIWAMQLTAWRECRYYYDIPDFKDSNGTVASECTCNTGVTYMRLNKDFRYFTFIEQPESFTKQFSDIDKLSELFRFLGDKMNLKVVMYLLSLDNGEVVGASTIATHLGYPKEKIEKALQYLLSINGSNKEIIEISVLCADNDKEKVYGVRNYLPEMLILLTGAFAVLNQPHGYQTSVNNRDYPFFDRKDMSFIKVGEKNEEK